MESAKTATYGKPILIYSSPFKRNILDVGGGDGSRILKSYSHCNYCIVDLKNGYDVMDRGLPKGDWDIIYANHIIEHVADTDKFLQICKEAMGNSTLLDIGTPNLCAWFNRILFLFGYLPHSYEVSYEKGYGRAFNWNDEEMGGHVRVYSVPALLQQLKYHGFKILSVKGEESFYKTNFLIKGFDKLMSKYQSLASSFRVICTLS